MSKVKSTRRTCPVCKKPKVIPDNRKMCHACRTLSARIKKGEIREPDYPEVNTANYKDPMQPVEGGFGYYGAITTTNDGEHIQCHICGYYYKSLGAHISNHHKMSPHDYKGEYGLRLKEGLLSPVQKVKAQARYNEYSRQSPEEMSRMSKKGWETRKAVGYQAGGNMWTAQTYNEKGMCRDQTLAKIRHLAEVDPEGIPKYQDFVSEYGSIDTVKHWFGSWPNALKEAGLESFMERRTKKRKERMANIESMIRGFYESEKRTPGSSDFNSLDWLPPQRTVTKLYGTLNKARVAAGVPQLLWQGGKWLEI